MDYYTILGLKSNATDACIKHAFRCRAKRLHPDVNSDVNAKQEFQLANEAYQVLKDADKRRLYDLRRNQGSLGRKVYYRPGKTSPSPSNTYAAYHYGEPENEYQPSLFEKLFDRFLFFSMLMLGLSALFYGIYRALGEPVEGMNPYLGIIFGAIFTGIFIYGWDKMQRLKK